MATLQEIKSKILESNASTVLLDDDVVVLTHEAMEEFGRICYMEGVNAGKPWGGVKDDHAKKFLSL